MKKPKPIKIQHNAVITLIGHNKNDLPYLHLSWSPDLYVRTGYIEDRDIKRLKKWCEICLKSMSKK